MIQWFLKKYWYSFVYENDFCHALEYENIEIMLPLYWRIVASKKRKSRFQKEKKNDYRNPDFE